MGTKRNIKLAKIFFEMADIYELGNERWKPQAYRIAAQTLESLRKDVGEIYFENGEKGIDNLSGIGEGITNKIVEFIKTGKIQRFEELKKTLPAGLYGMMNVPGVGPKKAASFFYELGIKNVAELKRAAQEHKLLGLKGFKKRAEEKVAEGISILKKQRGRILLKDAEKIADGIVRELKKLREVKRAIAVGSLRRKKPTIGDIDVVVETSAPEKVINEFVKMKFVAKVLAKGKLKASVFTTLGLQADLRVFDDESFGAGLLYFTGDKQHNIWLRKIAIKKGYKLNEYGLFLRGRRVAGRDEKEIYRKLGVKYVAPEGRVGEVR